MGFVHLTVLILLVRLLFVNLATAGLGDIEEPLLEPVVQQGQIQLM